jgi:PAS domain S-box-containing protein
LLLEHVQAATVEFELMAETSVIRNVNEAFIDVFGLATDEVLGESLNEYILPEWDRTEAAVLDARTDLVLGEAPDRLRQLFIFLAQVEIHDTHPTTNLS